MARPDKPNHGESSAAYAARVLREVKKEGKQRQEQMNDLVTHVFNTDPKSTIKSIRQMLAAEGEWRDRDELRIAIKAAIRSRRD
jgi:hypothetical protein